MLCGRSQQRELAARIECLQICLVMDDGMKGLAWGKMVLGGWRLLPSEFRSIFETDSLLEFWYPPVGRGANECAFLGGLFSFFRFRRKLKLCGQGRK